MICRLDFDPSTAISLSHLTARQPECNFVAAFSLIRLNLTQFRMIISALLYACRLNSIKFCHCQTESRPFFVINARSWADDDKQRKKRLDKCFLMIKSEKNVFNSTGGRKVGQRASTFRFRYHWLGSRSAKKTFFVCFSVCWRGCCIINGFEAWNQRSQCCRADIIFGEFPSC